MAISRSSLGESTSRPRPAPAPTAAGHLQAGDHRIFFELFGPESGPPVVLLHHGLGSRRAWRRQIPDLAEAGYRVVAYDRWGYGGSDPRPALDLPTFQADVDDLAALLRWASIDRVSLVGHSDGGTLALYFALRWPEKVWALITVAAHIYVEPSMPVGLATIEREYEKDAELREKLERAHGPKYDQVFHNWLDGWAHPRHLTWDMRPLLGAVGCPTLVIQGEEDGHATSRHARDLAAALARSDLWLIPGVGHMVPQEIPEEFNRRLLEFLGTTNPP